MNPTTVILIGFAILGIAGVDADGQLTYGDKCSVQTAILRVFANGDVPEGEKCNGNHGLICTGTCTCPPTRVWDKGPLFGLFGGGKCVAGANGPCGNNDRCVANAMCGENIPLCFCQEGYYAHDLQCISSSSYNLLSSGSTGPSASYRLSAVTLIPLIFAMKLYL